MPDFSETPTTVPMVSNMSIMQNVMIKVMIVNQPISAKPLKLSLKSVVSAISWNGGTKDADLRLAKGSVSKKIAWPAQ